MDKSDLLGGVSRAMMAEVAQDEQGPQTQFNVHVADVPPNIRNTAYEMAGAFFESYERSPEFRAISKRWVEINGKPMTAETYAIVEWPKFVEPAIACLTEALTLPGIPDDQKEPIAEEIIAFNAALDARAKSVVETSKRLN